MAHHSGRHPFHNLSALRQFDRYPLEITQPVFGHHFLAVLRAYAGKWAPAKIEGRYNTEVVFDFEKCPELRKDVQEQVATLCRGVMDEHFGFPVFACKADAFFPAEPQPGTCPMGAGMQSASQFYLDLESKQVGANKTASIWIAGDTRIRLVEYMIDTYCPDNAFRQATDLPPLVITMLAHASYKDIGLDFWPVKGAPAHIATGVGLGLPGRLSTEFLQDQKDAFFQQMIQGPGILLGVYIYIEHLLKDVPMQFRRGLLYSTIDAIFNKTEKPFQIPSETSKEWAGVLQRCVQVHIDLGMEIKMLQDVFTKKTQPQNTTLVRALQVGQVYEAMMNDRNAPPTVKDTEALRGWEMQTMTELGSADKLRAILVAHNCAAQVRAFDKFVQETKEPCRYLVVEHASAESTMAGLARARGGSTFIAEVADLAPEHHVHVATLLCMPRSSFAAYTRFACASLPDTRRWIPYAYAPVILQLWLAKSYRLAIELLRRFCQLPADGATRAATDTDIDTLASCLNQWAVEFKDKPVELVKLLPKLLALGPEDKLQCPAHEVKNASLFIDMGGTTWQWMMGLIVREKQDVQATAEAYTSCGSLVWPHKVMKENKKFDGLNQHPYRQRNLEDQAGHAILAKEKITQSTCQPAHLDNLWQVVAILEQIYTKQPVLLTPVKPLSQLRGPTRHFCLCTFDVPIAYIASAHERKDVFVGHNYFPVFPLRKPLDIPDGFRYIRASFKDAVTPEMWLNAANFPMTGGMLWKDRNSEILDELRSAPEQKSPAPPTPDYLDENPEQASRKRKRLEDAESGMPPEKRARSGFSVEVVETTRKKKLEWHQDMGWGFGSMAY